MSDEGIQFLPNTEIGKDISGKKLLASYNAVLLAIGSTVPRDLQIPGKILCLSSSLLSFIERPYCFV